MYLRISRQIMNAFTCGILLSLNFVSSRDLDRFVNYIGSTLNIGSFLVQYISYWNIG